MFRDSRPKLFLSFLSVIALAFVGCSKPVEYSAQATPDATEEAPPFAADSVPELESGQVDTRADSAESTAPTDPLSSQSSDPQSAEMEPTPETPPWRPVQEADTEADKPASAEAQRYFGNLPAANEPEDKPPAGDRYAADNSAGSDDDEGYLEFLQKQFGMTEEADAAEEKDEGASDEPVDEPSLVEIEITPEPEPTPSQLAQSVPEERAPEPVVEKPLPIQAPRPRYVDGGLGLKIGKLEMPRKKPQPKPEPQLEPVEPTPIAETQPAKEQPAPPEPTVPEPTVIAEELAPPTATPTELPWDAAPAETDAPAESVVDLPVPLEKSVVADPFDDPDSRYAAAPRIDETAPPADAMVAEPSVPILPSVESPPAEPPAFAPDEAPEPARVAVDPLPSVPVLPYNTRHLAWLLGGKLGLAQLAGVQGATPSEVEGWTEEANRLVQQLDIKKPAQPTPAGSAERRLKQLLTTSAALADGVARKHGQDHAALVEISLKTNALLVMFEDHPELAGPVARSVTSAAERAMLPGRLWRDATRRVEFAESSEELYDAVTRMHADVEAYLR